MGTTKRRSNAPGTPGRRLADSVSLLLYPDLAELPRGRWEAAIAAARDTDFNTPERIGLLLGVGFVAWLLRLDAGVATDLSLAGIYFVAYLLAVPLLALTVGPVLLHRTRRGLRAEIARWRRGEAEPPFHPADGGRR